MTFLKLILVAVGGSLGAVARFVISNILNKSDNTIPIGTLLINLSGAFLLGLITGLKSSEAVVLLFGIGFLGSFTTFSTLNLEATKLRFKRKKASIFYIAITYSFGIFLALIGYVLGKMAA